MYKLAMHCSVNIHAELNVDDCARLLINHGYSAPEYKEYPGGGHYGLPIHKLWECTGPDGAVHNAEHVIRQISQAAALRLLGLSS